MGAIKVKISVVLHIRLLSPHPLTCSVFRKNHYQPSSSFETESDGEAETVPIVLSFLFLDWCVIGVSLNHAST